MDYDTPLTAEGRARLRKVAEYGSWGYESRREALRSELGATQFSKGHVYTLPCIHEGRRHVESGYKETYVLKICSDCAGDGFTEMTHHWDRSDSSSCFLEFELGVWNDAVRRGDDDLLCPIVDADRSQGWMLMEHCDDPGALPDDHPYDGLKVRNSYHANRYIACRLRERGWLPSSTKRMDVEGMVLDGRLIAIDYENLYHEDWMFDPLCWRWSKFLRWDTPYTAATNLAIAERDHSGRVSSRHRRLVEEMHYSTILSRRSIRSLGRKPKKKTRH